VPPHWAELVTSLAAIPIYTEKQVGTWQSIPDIQTDNGDFSGKQHLSPTTSNQACEGVVEQHHITFADEVTQNDTDVVCQQPIVETIPNSWQIPIPINLDSSGLRCSSRPSFLNRRNKVYSNATQMTQDELLPAGLGLRSANCPLPAGLGLRSANLPISQ
jgi:hypothetical protein